MGTTSHIEWTDATWNIARGCTKVDEDCKFCYMYRDSMNGTRYKPLEVVRTKGVFNLPLRLKHPQKIFTSSLTDVFHPAIDAYRSEMWDIIRRCPQHTFQILTKRPERIEECLPDDWGYGYENVWLGTSIGSNEGIERAISLINIPCSLRFLSLEPLYDEIAINIPLFKATYGLPIVDHTCQLLYHFSWVIIGGESGNNTGKYQYRQCKVEWIEKLIKQCEAYNIPVFVKQLGTHLAKELGLKDRHGRNIDEWPEHLRIRQFPSPLNTHP